MDETPRFGSYRWLLTPAIIVLAIPAFVLLAVLLAIRTLFVGLMEAGAAILPWRRVETRVGPPFQGPHFRSRSEPSDPLVMQEKAPTQE